LVKKVRTYSNDPQLVIERRKLIAERSLKVFVEKGFKESTMRNLGAACGVTPGALYHYIGSKEDILHLIAVNYPIKADLLDKQLAELGNISRKKALLECFTLFCRQLEIAKDYNLLVERALPHISSQDTGLMAKAKIAVYYLFERLITEGINTGEFRVENTGLVVSTIMLYSYNWINRDWLVSDHFTLEEYVNQHFRALFEPSIVKTGKHVEKEYSPARQTAEATERDT